MLKTFFATLFFFFLSFSGYSQIKLYYGLGSTEVPGTVTFNDGHTEDGIVSGLVDRRYIYVKIDNPFKTIERQLNLTDNSFFFTNEQGKKRKIKSDEVNEISKKFEDGVGIYRRLNLKTINKKGKIIDLDREVWLPFFIKDRVNIMGVSSFTTTDRLNIAGFTISENYEYAGTHIYLNREGEDFAINPLDFNRISIFNMGSIEDKMKIALKETFRDCQSTLDYIDKVFADARDKGAMKEQRKGLLTSLKDIKKSDVDKEEKFYRTVALYEEMMLAPFIAILDHYNENCPE